MQWGYQRAIEPIRQIGLIHIFYALAMTGIIFNEHERIAKGSSIKVLSSDIEYYMRKIALCLLIATLSTTPFPSCMQAGWNVLSEG